MSRLQTLRTRARFEKTVCNIGYKGIGAKGACYACYWKGSACEATDNLIETHYDITKVIRTVYEQT